MPRSTGPGARNAVTSPPAESKIGGMVKNRIGSLPTSTNKVSARIMAFELKAPQACLQD